MDAVTTLGLCALFVSNATDAGCGAAMHARKEVLFVTPDRGINTTTEPTKPSPAATISDQWRPFVAEASQRFAVPENWIRAVMEAESGGQAMLNGEPITSSAGAMGLMQIMPGTYEELRARYGLGPDAYDPRDNILAGTAYLREMFERYGQPGFLAAYNAGPGRFDEYIWHARPLPNETIRYVQQLASHGIDDVDAIQTAKITASGPLFFILQTASQAQATDRPVRDSVGESMPMHEGLFVILSR